MSTFGAMSSYAMPPATPSATNAAAEPSVEPQMTREIGTPGAASLSHDGSVTQNAKLKSVVPMTPE